jgi:hypothetical protein
MKRYVLLYVSIHLSTKRKSLPWGRLIEQIVV